MKHLLATLALTTSAALVLADPPSGGSGGVVPPEAKPKIDEGTRATTQIEEKKTEVETVLHQASQAMTREDFTRNVQEWKDEGLITQQQADRATQEDLSRRAEDARRHLMENRVPAGDPQGNAWRQLNEVAGQLGVPQGTDLMIEGTDEDVSERGRQGTDTRPGHRHRVLTRDDVPEPMRRDFDSMFPPAYTGSRGGNPVTLGEWRARLEYFNHIEQQARLLEGTTQQAVTGFQTQVQTLENYAPQMDRIRQENTSRDARLGELRNSASQKEGVLAPRRTAVQTREQEMQSALASAQGIANRIDPICVDWSDVVPARPSEGDIAGFQGRHPGAYVRRDETPPDAEGNYTITWTLTHVDGKSLDDWRSEQAAYGARAAQIDGQLSTLRWELSTAETDLQTTRCEIGRLEADQRDAMGTLDRLQTDLTRSIDAVAQTVADLWRTYEEWNVIHRLARDATMEIMK